MLLGPFILTLASPPHASCPTDSWRESLWGRKMNEMGSVLRWGSQCGVGLLDSLNAARRCRGLSPHHRGNATEYAFKTGYLTGDQDARPQSLQCHWGHSTLLIISKIESGRCLGISLIQVTRLPHSVQTGSHTMGLWFSQSAIWRVMV